MTAPGFDPDRQVTAAPLIAFGADGLVIGDVTLDPFWIQDNVTILRTGASDNYEVTMTFLAERVGGDWPKIHDARPDLTHALAEEPPMPRLTRERLNEIASGSDHDDDANLLELIEAAEDLLDDIEKLTAEKAWFKRKAYEAGNLAWKLAREQGIAS